jgi:hypothetical protein
MSPCDEDGLSVEVDAYEGVGRSVGGCSADKTLCIGIGMVYAGVGGMASGLVDASCLA